MGGTPLVWQHLTMRGRWIRLGIGVAGTIAGLGAEGIALELGGRASDVLLDLAIGLTYLYGGLAIWGRAPTNRTGALMVGVGLTWFIRPLADTDLGVVSFLSSAFQDTWAVLLLALVLSYPSGRFETRVDRVGMTIFAIGVMALPILLLLPVPLVIDEGGNVFYVAFSLAVLAGVLVLRRWFLAPARRREDLLPVLVAGAVYVLTIAVNLIRRIALVPDTDAALAIAAVDLAPAAVPISLLIGFYRQSERRLQALVDAIPDPLLRIHRDGRFVDAGVGAPAGVSPRAPSGARLGNALWVSHPDALPAAVGRALDEDRLQSLDLSIELPEGRRELEVRLAPSGPDEVSAIVRDFTDQREAEAEVRRSRARIVEAADAERRRIERNLHDGAQQRLVGLSLVLRRARAQLSGEADRAASDALEEANVQLKSALAELRELARGIHPAILTEAGLGPALGALAAESPVETTLSLDLSAEVPSQVGVAAYFVVAEALANVAKYAEATHVEIAASADQDELRIEVRDDGKGGADPAAGSGLRGLADRAAALGGRLDIHSPAGEGTRIVASFPFTSGADAAT
jgi:signal transduction histidine kinase